jgi:O-antigen ligase
LGKKKKRRQVERSGTSTAVPALRQNPWQEWILFAIVALMVIYPPYFRGLFFHRAMFVTHILTALVFLGIIAAKCRNHDWKFIRTPLDGAVLAFALAYALSLITAVHFGDALYGFLKALNYFMLYWLVGRVITDHRRLEGMAHVLLLTALGVGLIGVLSASGYQVYPNAYENGLIHSTLQYHNATAAFLAAMSILGLALLIRKTSRPWLVAYSLVVFILQVIVFSTISKGAWLTLAVGGMVLVLGMPGWKRFKALYFLGGLGLVAFATGNRFLPAITGPNPHQGLPIIIVGLILAAVVCLLWEAAGYIIRTKPRGKHIVAAAGALLLLAGGYVLCSGNLGLSNLVLKEISEIGQTGSSSYVTRLDFMRWGVNIVKDYPIFGAGAGGWDGLYHRYQDYLFWTKEVHNHFIQVWVEAGTVGLLAFISIWLAMFWSSFALYRHWREKKEQQAGNPDSQNQWILVWGCTAAALTMALHASIDFDLSLPALSLVLFTLMGMINAAYTMNERKVGLAFSGWPAAALSILLGLFLFYMGTTALAAYQRSETGQDLARQAQECAAVAEKQRILKRSAQQYERAINLYPWDATYHADLASIYAEQYSVAQSRGEADLAVLFQKSVQAMERADQLSPGDMTVQKLLLDSAVAMGKFPLIMARLDATTATNPLDVGNYNSRATVLWKAAEYTFKNGEMSRSAEYVDAILLIPGQIEQQQARIKTSQAHWQGDKLEVTPTITLNLARANYLRGSYREAVQLLEPLYQISIKTKQWEPELIAEVQAVYAAALHKQGRVADARRVIDTRATAGVFDLYEDMIQWAVLP